jgi:ABC-type transport system involved in multi-copper enzyme maturation permease subunit
MITAIRAELRKLLTVRSTYILLICALLLGGFINFWAVGYKAGQGAINGTYLQDAVFGTLSGLSIFAGLAAILLMTHEYRYNTIYYALTSARSRTKLLLAKILVVATYALVFVAILASISVLMIILGLHVGHHELVAQQFHWGELLWRTLFFTGGTSLFGLVFAVLIRSQIGTIVLYMFMPSTIEPLAGLVLKDKVAYLPFTALNNLMMPTSSHMSYGKSAVVVLVWLLVGWVIAWLLFLKRDAN